MHKSSFQMVSYMRVPSLFAVSSWPQHLHRLVAYNPRGCSVTAEFSEVFEPSVRRDDELS